MVLTSKKNIYRYYRGGEMFLLIQKRVEVFIIISLLLIFQQISKWAGVAIFSSVSITLKLITISVWSFQIWRTWRSPKRPAAFYYVELMVMSFIWTVTISYLLVYMKVFCKNNMRWKISSPWGKCICGYHYDGLSPVPQPFTALNIGKWRICWLYC